MNELGFCCFMTLRQFGGGLKCSSPRLMYSTGTVEMPHLKIREIEGLKWGRKEHMLCSLNSTGEQN